MMSQGHLFMVHNDISKQLIHWLSLWNFINQNYKNMTSYANYHRAFRKLLYVGKVAAIFESNWKSSSPFSHLYHPNVWIHLSQNKPNELKFDSVVQHAALEIIQKLGQLSHNCIVTILMASYANHQWRDNFQQWNRQENHDINSKH